MKSKHYKIASSGIHNRGIFAKTDIKRGTEIIQYLGKKVTKKQGDLIADRCIEKSKKSKVFGAVYLFSLNKRYDLDGNVKWNPARYINHSCSPNCDSENIDGEIWIKATKDIKKGEELSYNYGYGWKEREDHPCKCSSDNCVGFILDKRHWWRLRNN